MEEKRFPNVYFCKSAEETMVHLLLECTHSTTLWEHIKEIDPNIVINFKNIILSTIHPSVTHVANTLAIIVKQFLYRYRCYEKQPNLKLLKNELSQVYYRDKYIAKMKHKSKQFNEKWQKATQLFFE